jgi:hypothetical protein
MKTKLLLVVCTALLIAVGWIATSFFRERHYHTTYHGHTMNQWLEMLATGSDAGTNALMLKQVITGDEPDVVSFEVPLSYDLFKKYDLFEKAGKIHLFVDGEIYEYQSYERATNGNFLLSWNTPFASPGVHRLYAEFWLCIMDRPPLIARGPIFSYHSTNYLQFDPFYSAFDDAHGAMLYAKVPKTNVLYSIELKTPEGVRIKTISGSTTNGEISERWNLIDEQGNKFTNDSFNAVFSVTLPDGTTQSRSSAKALSKKSQ